MKGFEAWISDGTGRSDRCGSTLEREIAGAAPVEQTRANSDAATERNTYESRILKA